jgi:hypothetical protein
VAANTKPVVRRLQRKVDVFRCFERQNCETSRARDGEQIQNAALAKSVGENLCVDEAGIQRCIDVGDIAAHDRFEPAFGLLAIERVSSVAGQRMAMNFEVLQ